MDKLLFITSGEQKGKTLPVTGEPITIGRDRRNTFSVDDEEVSRYHCEITYKHQCVYIEDLTSSNGTFVNGHMIRRSPLNCGDKIRIGGTHLQIQDSHVVSSIGSADGVTEAISQDQTETEVGLNLEGESTYFDIVADRGPDEAGRRFVQINNDLRFLYRASLATSRTVDTQRMLSELMDLIFDWINADHCYLFMKNDEDAQFSVALMRQKSPESAAETQTVQTYQSIVDYVCEHKVGVLSRKPVWDPRWRLPDKTKEQSRSDFVENESNHNEFLKRIGEVMCVPIQGRGELLGLIYVDLLENPDLQLNGQFNEDHLRLMLAMAHQAAVAIENQTYYSALVEKERMAAVGETASLMTHRINNILQGINGGSHLVEVGLAKKDFELADKGWQIVSGNQSKISELISDLLILGKPFEPEKTSIDFVTHVRETLAGLADYLHSEDVDCQFEQTSIEFIVQADEDALRLAIENLARIVVEACKRETNSKIHVSFEKSNHAMTMNFTYAGAEICLSAKEITDDPLLQHDRIIGGIEFAVSRKIIRGHDAEISVFKLPDGLNRVSISIPA